VRFDKGGDVRVYLSSPRNQLQAAAVEGMDVLVSFTCWSDFLRSYVPSFRRLLLDSGAYSVYNSGKSVDVLEYIDWVQKFEGIDAFAGLDDISGDYKKSLKNYKHGGFPTFHDTDPPGLLADLIDIAKERDGWIGIGLTDPRHKKDRFLKETIEQIPEDLHVHGWGLRRYRKSQKMDSFDSTSWWRDFSDIKKALPWLTPAECVDIVVKRERREVIKYDPGADQMMLGLKKGGTGA
jgi:hypothetical protein